LHTEALHKQNLNTEQLLETEAGTQRNFHKQTTKPQHRAAFRDGSWYAKKLSQTETFTHRGRFTQIFLCTEAFTQKKPLHREVFAHRSFYIQKLLCKQAFVQRSPYPSFIMSQFFMCHLHIFVFTLFWSTPSVV